MNIPAQSCLNPHEKNLLKEIIEHDIGRKGKVGIDVLERYLKKEARIRDANIAKDLARKIDEILNETSV